MRKVILAVLGLIAAAWVVAALSATKAHADYYNYPCTYPFVGTSADVDVIVHGGGQYCDGPMEINGAHYHCESGGGGIGGGALALAPIGGLSLGGFGGSGIGANMGRCQWECPDKTVAPPPNPPAAWVKHLIVDNKYNDCRDHMAPAGMDSAPQQPGSGPPAPGQPDVRAGQLPPEHPDAAAPPEPLGKPGQVSVPDTGGLLTPGSPMPIP
jgi:hypothetical protein